MKIAFHSPLKSPYHPVPSGDRLMARLLIAALERAGHEVEVISELRSFMTTPSLEVLAELEGQAEREIARISALWKHEAVPDLWLTYHPYYKAPDLLGPTLSVSYDIPYVTAEASYSARRNTGVWTEIQQGLLKTFQKAAVNICLTNRDRRGLQEVLPGARFAMLAPFIDCAIFTETAPRPKRDRLVTVAMMRSGDKMDSYRMLARSLSLLDDIPWSLSIVGDGACRAEVETLFAHFAPERIQWHGKLEPSDIATLFAQGALYVWPGCGEAYGLAYLEAQAAGLPVIAQAIAGVPEVVRDGRTGILTPPGDIDAYADAIRLVLANAAMRNDMAFAARQFVRDERSLEVASRRLDDILKQHVGIL
ncbi:glycosyltransferase family 4 protein [Ochrobactrum soli]|uniref:Glycosyltransferase family 4 protein n=1 Tax=Ochrobactrum soli TaxID=2448455 RepID=A0A849KQB4_9HYPH|nr:glycosyltransferase family 4 protein [[Ochrobactrum] soli]NNU60028.1 glycosyltransferase family 4 protein [[Ochrobactrum] soli]